MFIKFHNSRYVIVLDRNQPLLQSLTELAQKHNILGGSLNGIGALKNVELGYYELHKKEYVRKFFNNEDFELLTLSGNVSWRDGAPYIHAHTALGRSDFSVIGGHLFEAQVAVTAEIYLTPFGVMPERTPQPELGLQTITHCRL